MRPGSVFGVSGKRPQLKLREALSTLVKLSLLQGTIAGGMYQHDILRDFVMSRIPDLMGQQRRMVEGIMDARPEGGWPSIDSVEQGTASWYVATQLWWHIRGAISGDLDDVASQELVGRLVESEASIAEACAMGLRREGMESRIQWAEDRGDLLLAAKLCVAASLPGRHGPFPMSEERDLLWRAPELLVRIDNDVAANRFDFSFLMRLYIISPSDGTAL
jgi:hypothetical protein